TERKPLPSEGLGKSVQINAQIFASRDQPQCALSVLDEQVLRVGAGKNTAERTGFFDSEYGRVYMGSPADAEGGKPLIEGCFPCFRRRELQFQIGGRVCAL